MKKILFLAVLLCVLIMPDQAAAHVLVTDTSGQAGMIVHIQPDDDPIAGEPAHFYFDMADTDASTDGHVFTFIIKDEAGNQEVAYPTVAGPTSLSLSYTFPRQGTYQLQLEVSGPQSRDYHFSQLVSRGVAGSPLDEPRYAWAEFLLVISPIALGILVLIAYLRRKQILAYTKKL